MLLRAALRSVRYGNRLRDKLVITAHLGTVALFPLGIAARKVGIPLPDPRRWLGEYVVRGPAGVFVCPACPAPFFFGVDPVFEPPLCAIIDRLEGGTFVDAGASIGFITVRAAKRVDHVIAVEPHPVRFAYLERNVELNGLTTVTCVNCALGSENGMAALYDVDPTLGPHPSDASSRPGKGHRYDVPLRRLDDLVHDQVSLVKVDVEGDEVSVLLGARRLLESRPLVVVDSRSGETLPELRELLPGYSFDAMDDVNFLASP